MKCEDCGCLFDTCTDNLTCPLCGSENIKWGLGSL